MNFKLKNILGFEEFKERKDVLNYISNTDGSQIVKANKCLIIEENNDLKLWIVVSEPHVFIVRDNGYKLTIILKRKLDAFSFNLINENNLPRLFIHNTKTTLAINTSITGSASTFQSTLSDMIGSHAIV